MLTVLHVTPHLNGGLGRVMLSTLKSAESSTSQVIHKIAVTEKLNQETRQLFGKYIEHIEDSVYEEALIEKIEYADIVQFEWWNHPLIYKMLFTTNLPPCRLVVSSHVSGFYRPQIINQNIVKYCDLFLCTTKATEKHPAFASYSDDELRKRLSFVTYPVDFDRFNDFTPKPHLSINIGYVGTLDYSKLHSNFLKMSSDVTIDNINYIVCGTDQNGSIEKQSYEYRPSIFDFRGFQSDIRSTFEEFDIFAYPLSATHFGSGEQAIIEAMYVGLPVIAFENAAEKEIIRHNETGLLVKTEKEYTQAIEYLCKNPAKRKELGDNARKDIVERLSPEKCFNDLEKTYLELLSRPKTSHKLTPLHPSVFFTDENDEYFGAKLFLESLGADNNQFAESFFNRKTSNIVEIDDAVSNAEQALKVKSKGSIYQYLHFFPTDPYLNFWIGLLKQKDNEAIKALEHFKKASYSSIPILDLDKYISALEKKLH